jgi:stage II sporulation protein M
MLWNSLTIFRIYQICTVIFFITALLACVYTDPVSTKQLNENINASFSYIFLNNLKVACFLIFLGPVTFGLGTFTVLIINALVLGGVFGSIKADLSLMRLLIPHGIIEIPILLFAASIGVKLALNLLKLQINLRLLLKHLVIVIVGLLVAAGIETLITPMFLKGV